MSVKENNQLNDGLSQNYVYVSYIYTINRFRKRHNNGTTKTEETTLLLLFWQIIKMTDKLHYLHKHIHVFPNDYVWALYVPWLLHLFYRYSIWWCYKCLYRGYGLTVFLQFRTCRKVDIFKYENNSKSNQLYLLSVCLSKYFRNLERKFCRFEQSVCLGNRFLKI